MVVVEGCVLAIWEIRPAWGLRVVKVIGRLFAQHSGREVSAVQPDVKS